MTAGTPLATQLLDGDAWQESWDRQQQAYMPDREERFRAMIDAVDAVVDGVPAPRILDLAAGTGSISLRLLHRLPGADVTLVDLDPVLLTIATASLGERVRIAQADLRGAGWLDALPHKEYDAVLTATALHWLPAGRITVLYEEIAGLVRPGGVFVNADHIPPDGLPRLSEALRHKARSRRLSRHASAAVPSWEQWWRHVSDDPVLGGLMSRRAELFGGDHPAEWTPPAQWHVTALLAAGFREAGVLWRGGADAAVAALR